LDQRCRAKGPGRRVSQRDLAKQIVKQAAARSDNKRLYRRPSEAELTAATGRWERRLSAWKTGNGLPRDTGQLSAAIAVIAPDTQSRFCWTCGRPPEPVGPLRSSPSPLRPPAELDVPHEVSQEQVVPGRWPRVGERGVIEVGVHESSYLPPSESPLTHWLRASVSVGKIPTYVSRDHDEQLRTSLRTAAEHGHGVLLVVGRSCTREDPIRVGGAVRGVQ